MPLKSSTSSIDKLVVSSAGASPTDFTSFWALDPLEAALRQPLRITFGFGPELRWSTLWFEPLETSAWPVQSSGIRLLCHLLVERVPVDVLPQLARAIEDLQDYYSRPISVTPDETIRRRTGRAGGRSNPPAIELAEA